MNSISPFLIPRFFILSALLGYTICTNAGEDSNSKDVIKQEFKSAISDYKLSPYTGYTREHWLEITAQIIAGVLPYLDTETGIPRFPIENIDYAYEKVRTINAGEDGKRTLERIMMAVIFYTRATGKDQVPGYQGSISAPFIRAILKGTDPKDPGYWGEPEPLSQVGSAISLAVYINPEVFWEPLSPIQKRNVLNYLQRHSFNQTYDNNHYYFHMLPVALLEKNGMDANKEHLTQMFRRLMGWYRGDGWFIDGGNRGFDYYNLWGFQLFNQVLFKYDQNWRDLFGAKITQTTNLFFETLPYLSGRDGGPIPWGRSLSYRFAGISSIAWAVINGTCTLPPGQARRIASGTLKYFWDHGCLGSNNLLNIGYWGTNASIAEKYLSPGDPYWATQGLACLLIPREDPFWNDVEEPIPADGAGGKIAVPGAQFTVRVSPLDGEARLFPVGQPFAQERNKWQNGAKYDQHGYSSFLGFCTLGEGGGDSGAGRSGYSYDGTHWFYRERAKAIQIDPNHLISRYSIRPKGENDLTNEGNRDEMITHTLVGNDGEIHIFWHNYPEPLYMYLGGYGVSIPVNEALSEQRMKNNLLISGGDYYSAIQAILAPDGKFESRLLVPREGWTSTHLFGGKGAFPFWHSLNPVPPNVPVIFYVNGTRTRKPIFGSIQITQNRNELSIRFEGQWHKVQIPY